MGGIFRKHIYTSVEQTQSVCTSRSSYVRISPESGLQIICKPYLRNAQQDMEDNLCLLSNFLVPLDDFYNITEENYKTIPKKLYSFSQASFLDINGKNSLDTKRAQFVIKEPFQR